MDEPAWEALVPLPVTQQLPTFQGEPSERTEFRVAYDDDAIYFSCRAWDRDPAGIQAPSLKRDDNSFANDWCVINLDTFGDRETALVFGTSPAGIRTEVVFPNDGSSPQNLSWNTFWDAAVTRDERGWYAEIRIPFSSLRFQEDADGVVRMGLAVWRRIARRNEMLTYPAIPPRWGELSVFHASRFQQVELQGVVPTRPLYVTPYALGGLGRSYALNVAGTGYDPVRDRVREAGIDLKVGLASNLTLDLTVNTDFAQVEADDQQVNLTRFSLFFPEKRLFFQERSSIFDFSLGGNERLFHSRRIGIFEGERVPILAGARVVGRVGGWDLGLLDMQTGETAFSPSENMGVLRLRRRVLNENSYVGAIATSRVTDGAWNLVYGADALLRLFGQDYLAVEWAQSFQDDEADAPDPGTPPAPGPDALDRGLARLAWERRGVDGLIYSLDVARAGDAFDPRLGFLQRRDYTKGAGRVAYGWRPGPRSPVLTHGPSLAATVFRRSDDGVVETVQGGPEYQLALKAGHVFGASAITTYENLDAGFSLADTVSVPAGQHEFAVARLSFQMPSSGLVRFSASAEAGGFYDGRVTTASFTPRWSVSKHLELSGSYTVSDIRFPSRDQRLLAHVGRLRSLVMIDSRLSLAAFVQYASSAERVTGNIRFRFNPSEGHDLYAVWNQGVHTDRAILDPTPPLLDRATLIIKYSRTFTVGW